MTDSTWGLRLRAKRPSWMATTWYRALDLFSDTYIRWVHEAIERYRDVPLDGTALDEFGFVRIPMTPVTPWRGHLAGKAFGEQFEKATGLSLTQTLFETRYAPAGQPEVRIQRDQSILAVPKVWAIAHRAGVLPLFAPDIWRQ